MPRILNVRVQPRSSQEKVVRCAEDSYRIYTHKPAIDGEANRAVIRILAEFLGVKKSELSIYRGDKSRDKQIEMRC